jgi:hypothetical protein
MSTNVDQIDRASKFLKDNSLKEHSILRKFCMASLDILLVGGMIYLLARVVDDQEYWHEARYPMHAVILLQYFGLALLIRLPVSRIKSTT